jgi:hypothetical protein
LDPLFSSHGARGATVAHAMTKQLQLQTPQNISRTIATLQTDPCSPMLHRHYPWRISPCHQRRFMCCPIHTLLLLRPQEVCCQPFIDILNHIITLHLLQAQKPYLTPLRRQQWLGSRRARAIPFMVEHLSTYSRLRDLFPYILPSEVQWSQRHPRQLSTRPRSNARVTRYQGLSH